MGVFVMKINSKTLWRFGIYAVGLVILAIGIVLNTETTLGVSPIISVPYSISSIWTLNFAFITLLVYILQVILQFLIKGKNKEWKDALQILVCLAFTSFLGLFEKIIVLHPKTFLQKFLVLLAAILITAVGAAMTVNMKIVPNPADGLAKTVGDALHKDMGFGKNVIDLISVAITCLIGFACTGHVVAIGIGTVCAMVGVGRAIALFNYFCKEKMDTLAGL